MDIGEIRVPVEACDEIVHWAIDIASDHWVLPSDVDTLERQLCATGAFHRRRIGQAASGTPIHVLASTAPGSDERSLPVVAYGYPHPDEPSGATALASIALAIATGRVPDALRQVRWHLVICADPDNATQNERWISSPRLSTYLRHNWRPIKTHQEVEWHFPIDHDEFWQPDDHTIEGYAPPIPESLALARLLREVRPAVLGLMHGNHVSGAYTFLSHQPSQSTVDMFDRTAHLTGVRIHSGDQPDPGDRWFAERRDFLREERIAVLRARMKSNPASYVPGCVSVSAFVDALRADAYVITPEVGMFNAEPSTDHHQERFSVVTETVGQRTAVWWNGHVVHRLDLGRDEHGARAETWAATEAMITAKALARRLSVLQASARLLRPIELPQTVRFREYQLRVLEDTADIASEIDSASYCRKRSRSASSDFYADVTCRHLMEAALVVGHGIQLLNDAGLDRLATHHAALLTVCERDLQRMVRPVPVASQVASQIARLALTVLSRPELR